MVGLSPCLGPHLLSPNGVLKEGSNGVHQQWFPELQQLTFMKTSDIQRASWWWPANTVQLTSAWSTVPGKQLASNVQIWKLRLWQISIPNQHKLSRFLSFQTLRLVQKCCQSNWERQQPAYAKSWMSWHTSPALVLIPFNGSWLWTAKPRPGRLHRTKACPAASRQQTTLARVL